MTIASDIAADIGQRIPEVKSGSLAVYGDVFGGRVDNIHTVVRAHVDDDGACLVLEFNEGESLRVWNPEGAAISGREFRIQRASRVRWEWYYYGRPHAPENRYYIEHVCGVDGVDATTNADWAPHDFAPSVGKPAVELLGLW
ncbi:hypothetical protein [Nocardioides sp.]|uniref:hypothetical protein n=1 Tax=Nocardioides sp. TaxID=35761 RepID=UPI0035637690